MKEKVVEYKLFFNANKLNEIILTDLKNNLFKKRHKLSGEISNDGGLEIRNRATLIGFEPDHGSLIKLNLVCVNLNTEGTESKLRLKRVNGLTFYIQYYFTIFFTLICTAIVFYQVLINKIVKIEFFLLPIFGIVYHLIIRLIARGSFEILISNIEKMLEKEKIEYEKL